jgi:hypothetical protein
MTAQCVPLLCQSVVLVSQVDEQIAFYRMLWHDRVA